MPSFSTYLHIQGAIALEVAQQCVVEQGRSGCVGIINEEFGVG